MHIKPTKVVIIHQSLTDELWHRTNYHFEPWDRNMLLNLDFSAPFFFEMVVTHQLKHLINHGLGNWLCAADTLVPETRPEMQHKHVFCYFCTSLWSTKSQSELISDPYQGARYITVAHFLGRQHQTVKKLIGKQQKVFHSSKSVWSAGKKNICEKP